MSEDTVMLLLTLDALLLGFAIGMLVALALLFVEVER